MYSQPFPQSNLYGAPNMMQYQGMMPQQVPPPSGMPGMVSNYNNNNNNNRGGGGYDMQQQQQQAPPPPPPPPQQQMGQQPQQMGQQPQQQQQRHMNNYRQQPRPRNNEIGEVSRVVHMRNITPNVTQLSIQNLVQNFGTIRHIVMLRQMNQALVEMDTVKSAQQLVDFFRETGYAEIDGRRVYIRYSNHQELTATQHTSKTLLVSMFNTQYDVSATTQITPTIVYQIFGNYGAVQKIVVLPKNESSQRNHNRVQALVQFDSKATAESVKSILQGQPVTIGETITFTLDIQFSRMDDIKTSNPAMSLVVGEDGTPQPPPPQQQQQQQPPPQHMQQIQGGNMYSVIPPQWS